MFNPDKRLIVDIKVQNRLREWFSRIADNTRGCEKITCIQFGDSDVNYELGYDYTKIRVLNAPYNVESIKNKLIFEGINKGVKASIKSYFRQVDDSGNVYSYYNYPSSVNLTVGVLPPTVNNGWDKDELLLTRLTREGYLCFNETLPDNYLDENGIPLRLNETYQITLNCPGGQIPPLIIDEDNGSFFLFNNNITDTSGTIIGNIEIIGLVSGIKKIINLKIQ